MEYYTINYEQLIEDIVNNELYQKTNGSVAIPLILLNAIQKQFNNINVNNIQPILNVVRKLIKINDHTEQLELIELIDLIKQDTDKIVLHELYNAINVWLLVYYPKTDTTTIQNITPLLCKLIISTI